MQRIHCLRCCAVLVWIGLAGLETAGAQTIMPSRPGGFQPPPPKVTMATASTTTTLPLDIRAPGALDVPANNATVSGQVRIEGWLVPIRNGSAAEVTSRFELRVDGLFVQPLTERFPRPDVQKGLAKMGIKVQANVGFSGTWDSRTVAEGVHVLSVRAIFVSGNRGLTVEIGSNLVTVKNPATSRSPASRATTTTLPKKKIPEKSGTGTLFPFF